MIINIFPRYIQVADLYVSGFWSFEVPSFGTMAWNIKIIIDHSARDNKLTGQK